MDDPRAPRVFETHISTVVLVGDRALKFPKPVRTAFLDQSTPELRRAACEQELALNRRLAPDVYLGVGAVPEGGQAADWFLVMRRMPDDARLSRLVGTSRFPDALREVVRTVATFHAAQPPSPDAETIAGEAGLRALWVDKNLDEMQRFAGTLLDAGLLAEVEDLARRYLAGRGPLFAERIERGWIRDGHGDLLADDIFVLDDGPRILDCIAFDASLREGDVLADIAFLAMDLERLAGPPVVEAVLQWYSELTNERHPRSLAELYIAYRALVRAKVNCIHAEQGDPDAARRATTFLQQCVRHLRRAQPRLVLVGGPPGTGKSTVAGVLADADELTLLSSDEVRKDLAGVERTARLDPIGYTAGARHDVYTELLHRARLLLERGESVVLDATWGDPAERARAEALAAEVHAAYAAVHCVLDPALVRERVRARAAAAADASDADEAVAAKLGAEFAPWPGALVLDTSRSLDEVAAEVWTATATRPARDVSV